MTVAPDEGISVIIVPYSTVTASWWYIHLIYHIIVYIRYLQLVLLVFETTTHLQLHWNKVIPVFRITTALNSGNFGKYAQTSNTIPINHDLPVWGRWTYIDTDSSMSSAHMSITLCRHWSSTQPEQKHYITITTWYMACFFLCQQPSICWAASPLPLALRIYNTDVSLTEKNDKEKCDAQWCSIWWGQP